MQEPRAVGKEAVAVVGSCGVGHGGGDAGGGGGVVGGGGIGFTFRARLMERHIVSAVKASE